jgi:hypothetical protein
MTEDLTAKMFAEMTEDLTAVMTEDLTAEQSHVLRRISSPAAL